MQKKINWLAGILLLYVCGALVLIFVLWSTGGERSHFYSCLLHSTVHPRVFLQQEIKYENHQSGVPTKIQVFRGKIPNNILGTWILNFGWPGKLLLHYCFVIHAVLPHP